MEKQEKLAHSLSHRKCQLCHKETTYDCTFTDVAHYAPDTGNIMMVARLSCSPCREELLSIRQYVEEQGLSFGKNSALFKESIEPLLPREAHSVVGEETSIFQKNVEQDIKRNKLYHCAKLPHNCLQLIYYSSFTINHAERHERIRNAIGQVMKVAPIPYGNLEDIAILVHCLSCYMHEDNVILLLKTICHKLLLEGSPINSHFESELPIEPLWREIYSGCFIGNLIIILSVLLQDWISFKSYFEKLRGVRGYLHREKLTNVIGLGESSPVLKKVCSLPIEPEDTNECKKCNKNRLLFLVWQAREKNEMSLTLKYLLKEDTDMKEYINQMETKFIKEKEEFINKIIKLKDKIEALEHTGEIKHEIIRRPRSSSDFNSRIYFKDDLDHISEKSEGTTKTIALKEKFEENGQTNETDKSRSSLNQLQRLVPYLPDFDPSLLSQEADESMIAEALENFLKSTKDELEKLDKKNKVLENESKRLLAILTRKEERFIPLIHEKDEIIEKYENALWRMEHNLQVEDPSLAPRIANIISVFRSDFLESMTSGTLESDINYEDVVQFTPSKSERKEKKEKKSKTAGNKSDEKSSNKKMKSEEKECVIF